MLINLELVLVHSCAPFNWTAHTPLFALLIVRWIFCLTMQEKLGQITSNFQTVFLDERYSKMMKLELLKCRIAAVVCGFPDVLVRFNLPLLNKREVSIGTHIVVVVHGNSRHEIIATDRLSKNNLSLSNLSFFLGIRNDLILIWMIFLTWITIRYAHLF